MLQPISVVIITRNAAATLADTLLSTTAFPEVVVYDNGSDDTTLEIARSFDNVALHQGSFTGFGPTKNHAVSLASNDWVLSLDADEQLSPELAEYIGTWQPANDNVVGVLRRHNYFMGKHVERGGWSSDWIVRMFNRRTHQFNNLDVHEKVSLNPNSEQVQLPHYMRHDAVLDIGQFLVKVNRYSEIQRHMDVKLLNPAQIYLRSIFAFFRSYILKGGVLAGWRGLVIAWNEANGVFFKYMKPYADRHH